MVKKNQSILPEIEVLSLFPEINKELIALLKNLSLSDWDKPTVLPGRTVKDLTSHLLDGSLRRLSLCRDNYQLKIPQFKSNEEVVKYVQEINKSWIEATKRLSPQILISLLELSEVWVYEYFKTLDLQTPAKLPVSWAGQMESPNWFDIAREYTEKWHHQMQIRLAVNKPGISSKKLFYPVIDCFMRGLPYTYCKVQADAGIGIEIEIEGNGGGLWFLEKRKDEWCLVKKLKNIPKATIKMSDEIAWQLFTDSISKEIAAKHMKFSGPIELATPFLTTRTVLR